MHLPLYKAVITASPTTPPTNPDEYWAWSMGVLITAVGTLFWLWYRDRRTAKEEIQSVINSINALDADVKENVCKPVAAITLNLEEQLRLHQQTDPDGVPVWYITQKIRNQLTNVESGIAMIKTYMVSVDRLTQTLSNLDKNGVETSSLLQTLKENTNELNSALMKMQDDLKDLKRRQD